MLRHGLLGLSDGGLASTGVLTEARPSSDPLCGQALHTQAVIEGPWVQWQALHGTGALGRGYEPEPTDESTCYLKTEFI